MVDIIIDATDLIAGRIGTVAAREALHGNNVVIINAEKAAVSGRKPMLVAAWKRKYSMGVPRKGPFIHRHPDRFLRRMIRGMLPYKSPRGRDAFKRIMCHIGVPDEFKDAKAITIEEASIEKLPRTRYLTVGQLCTELGGSWHE